MEIKSNSLRSFLGSKNFSFSRDFYTCLGFKEIVIDKNMSLFIINDSLSFYLQDAYVKDWIENTMVFWEVSNLESVLLEIKSLNLESKFADVRVSKIVHNSWGNEFFVHDPAGILWHIGEFK